MSPKDQKCAKVSGRIWTVFMYTVLHVTGWFIKLHLHLKLHLKVATKLDILKCNNTLSLSLSGEVCVSMPGHFCKHMCECISLELKVAFFPTSQRAKA